MSPDLIKQMSQGTAEVIKDVLKPLKARLKQVETQGDVINANFADINARLSAIEDMLTDPGTRV